jgi:DNA (cytosine-5)-methyltransferase 1
LISKKKTFTFIDLFSGIGGFHIGMSNVGGKCLMASDIEAQANESYFRNFGIKPEGDISSIKSSEIPNFDVLCGGFPCQSFSNVGQKGGLEDPRGSLIFEVIRILKEKQPKAFILENVKGMVSHDKGRTFETIIKALRSSGYSIEHEVLEAKDYGLPQIRKRLFIVGVRSDIDSIFTFPEKTDKLDFTLEELFEGEVERKYAFTVRIGGRRSGINNRYNWDAYKVNGEVQYITPEQCIKIQGFPKNYILTGAKGKQYKQAGNSVPVNVVQAIGQKLKDLSII